MSLTGTFSGRSLVGRRDNKSMGRKWMFPSKTGNSKKSRTSH